jgi:hypothetical protein
MSQSRIETAKLPMLVFDSFMAFVCPSGVASTSLPCCRPAVRLPTPLLLPHRLAASTLRATLAPKALALESESDDEDEEKGTRGRGRPVPGRGVGCGGRREGGGEVARAGGAAGVVAAVKQWIHG